MAVRIVVIFVMLWVSYREVECSLYADRCAQSAAQVRDVLSLLLSVNLLAYCSKSYLMNNVQTLHCPGH